jgi:hypothetical protein
MRLRFTTENGTRYEVFWNGTTGTWKRLSFTLRSGKTSHIGGTLVARPRVWMGRSAIMEDSNVLPGHFSHAIVTSHVVVIEDLESGSSKCTSRQLTTSTNG